MTWPPVLGQPQAKEVKGRVHPVPNLIPTSLAGAFLLTVALSPSSCVPTQAEDQPNPAASGILEPHPTGGKEPKVWSIAQTSPGATRLWAENCASCHGQDGGGGGARTLLTRELFHQDLDRRFFDATKNGDPETGMPAFGETLADNQIWALVVHIRELQGRALARQGEGVARDGLHRGKRATFRIEDVVTSGLRTPWGVAWLSDGRMLVTNREGYLLLVDQGRSVKVEGIPPTADVGQGGLMAVTVHPQAAQNGWVYLALNDRHPDGRRSITKIVRGKVTVDGDQAKWKDNQTIWQAPEDTYGSGPLHFGSRIVFDGKGHIFFCIGERGNGNLAQDLSKPNGKVFRLKDDGKVPEDNPFVGREGAIPAVWSFGHRNPQGMAFGADGRLWITEHGPRGGDELNEIVKGANYGWPVVSFGIDYSDAPFRVPWPSEDAGFTMPVYRWIPSTGVCGLATAKSRQFPGWEGDLLAGGLAGQCVDRIRVRDGKFVEVERVMSGLGRVRDVALGPDGLVYVVLNTPDKVVRLVP